jgi:acetyl esterase/lipase
MTANYNNLDTARANSIHTICLNNKAKAKNIPFYIITSEGSRWPDINWAPDAKALAEKMTSDGIIITYEFIPGVHHGHRDFWDIRKKEIISFIKSHLVLPEQNKE